MRETDKCWPLAVVICSCLTYGWVSLRLYSIEVIWFEAPESKYHDDGEMDAGRAVGELYRLPIIIEVKAGATEALIMPWICLRVIITSLEEEAWMQLNWLDPGVQPESGQILAMTDQFSLEVSLFILR